MKLSFIIYFKIDDPLRLKNLEHVGSFYANAFPEAEFIFAYEICSDQQQSGVRFIRDYLPPSTKVKIVYMGERADMLCQKSRGYNLGAKEATGDVLIFLDIDVIVDPAYFLPEIEELYNHRDLGVHVGYNGVALYMTHTGARNFLRSGSIQLLNLFLDKYPEYNRTGYSNDFFLCGNTKAIGGFLAMTKQTFEDINGFNPNFIGWGFEDNEIICRAHRLGNVVTKSNTTGNVLYHLPHDDGTRDKSIHPHYEQNKEEFIKIQTMPIAQLKQHIKTW